MPDGDTPVGKVPNSTLSEAAGGVAYVTGNLRDVNC